MGKRILIIDDDSELGVLLTDYFGREGYGADTAHDGESGLEALSRNPYSLVILDVMLPDRDGFEVLKEIRKRSEIPVIMLTAKGEDVDRIVGLELGADDYLPKPFNPRELLARVRAVLRRLDKEHPSQDGHFPDQIEAGPVAISFPARRATFRGEPLNLTAVEFDLLCHLVNRAGEVLSREFLVKEVLKREFSPFDRSIDVHVSRLRKKLGDGSNLIQAVRGEGYVFVIPEDAP